MRSLRSSMADFVPCDRDPAKGLLHLSKTWEMILTGNTAKQMPDPLPSIGRKPEHKLLGVTFNQDPCKWDTRIDLLLHKASSR